MKHRCFGKIIGVYGLQAYAWGFCFILFRGRYDGRGEGLTCGKCFVFHTINNRKKKLSYILENIYEKGRE